MTKLKLCALSSQKNEILDALSKTRSVEVIDTEEVADTFLPSETVPDELIKKSGEVKDCIEFVFKTLSAVKGEAFYDKSRDIKGLSDTPVIGFDEFFSIKEKEAELNAYVERTLGYEKKIAEEVSSRQKITALYEQYVPYKEAEGVFSDYKDTAKTKVRLGQIKKDGIKLLSALSETDIPVAVTEYSGSDPVTVVVVSLKENDDVVAPVLSSNGFTKCPFTESVSAAEELKRLDKEYADSIEEEKRLLKAVYDEADKIKDLYVLADYYKFGLEKFKDSEKFRYTSKTFVLEGYLPKEKEEEVKSALNKVTEAVVVEYSVPTDDDTPPTLCKNNKLVSQAEFVTDMYSTPDYREYDPNGFVFFFYMMFMGVIMADVGYGALMIILGLVLAKRTKPGKSPKLWNVIAISGAFTILWGALFNSYFGFALPYKAILPSPIPDGGDTSGMKLILLLCLLMGVIHIAAGYLVKAINFFRKGDIFGGICEGISWVVFFIGFVFAAFVFILNYLVPGFVDSMKPGVRTFFESMTVPGLITAAVGLVFAAVFAGRHEKGFGKFTKAFGSVYGLINLMSDILSYARLFGLMLSGMMIAQTFNVNLAAPIMANGGFGIVAGILIMIAGHAFNLAMGVLGAYIHDSRLQYIEFFGKFYTGEGRPFVPLGSKYDYIYVSPEK